MTRVENMRHLRNSVVRTENQTRIMITFSSNKGNCINSFGIKDHDSCFHSFFRLMPFLFGLCTQYKIKQGPSLRANYTARIKSNNKWGKQGNVQGTHLSLGWQIINQWSRNWLFYATSTWTSEQLSKDRQLGEWKKSKINLNR